MEILLKKLLPRTLAHSKEAGSGIWNMEILFEAGQKIQVTAPSGRGKTTFISLLYGLGQDYDGKIFLDGKDTGGLSLRDWSKLRQESISVIFQDLRLFDEFTGLENIYVKSGLTNTTTTEEIYRMTERLGIDRDTYKKAAIMSWGEKQRVAIVRALTQPFRWLLMDEPFSHLDHDNREKAAALIIEECDKRKAGIILTSLDGDALFPYSQKIDL